MGDAPLRVETLSMFQHTCLGRAGRSMYFETPALGYTLHACLLQISFCSAPPEEPQTPVSPISCREALSYPLGILSEIFPSSQVGPGPAFYPSPQTTSAYSSTPSISVLIPFAALTSPKAFSASRNFTFPVMRDLTSTRPLSISCRASW